MHGKRDGRQLALETGIEEAVSVDQAVPHAALENAQPVEVLRDRPDVREPQVAQLAAQERRHARQGVDRVLGFIRVAGAVERAPMGAVAVRPDRDPGRLEAPEHAAHGDDPSQKPGDLRARRAGILRIEKSSRGRRALLPHVIAVQWRTQASRTRTPAPSTT